MMSMPITTTTKGMMITPVTLTAMLTPMRG
jgi:hypothetical protein